MSNIKKYAFEGIKQKVAPHKMAESFTKNNEVKRLRVYKFNTSHTTLTMLCCFDYSEEKQMFRAV